MPTTRWWTGALAPFDWSAQWLPLQPPAIRIEEYVEDDVYTLRAEVPGVNPEKDIEITYADGALRLRVERSEEHKDKRHSEFHYGSFTRTVVLPVAAREDSVAATYQDGILEITAKLATPEMTAKAIPVEVKDGKKK